MRHVYQSNYFLAERRVHNVHSEKKCISFSEKLYKDITL